MDRRHNRSDDLPLPPAAAPTFVHEATAGLPVATAIGSAEHTIVALLGILNTPDGALPRGARGVVHDCSADGSWYLVEFSEPFFCVVDVPAAQLVAA